MSVTKLLVLPSSPAAPALLYSLDPMDGRVSREQLPAGAAAFSPPLPCLLAVPATDVGLHRLRLRARSSEQAAAAAVRLLGDKLAVAHASLHVAVSEADADDVRWVALVDPARMRAWLDLASRHGLLPTAMVPDCLLLPPSQAQAWRFLDAGETWWVRGADLAFTAEPELARGILDSHGLKADQGQAANDVELAQAALRGMPEIDLLQQAFSLRAPAPTGWAAWRNVATLAGVLLAALPLSHAALALRHELAVRSIHADATARLQALPDLPGNATPPFMRADRALAAARARDAFAITTGAVFGALAELPTAGVNQLDFGTDGVLAVAIDHDQSLDPEQFKALLGNRGVSVSLDATRPSGDRMRTTLFLAVSP